MKKIKKNWTRVNIEENERQKERNERKKTKKYWKY